VRGSRFFVGVLAVDADAPTGFRDITITNPDGGQELLRDALAITRDPAPGPFPLPEGPGPDFIGGGGCATSGGEGGSAGSLLLLLGALALTRRRAPR
jgi:MYXO-CTERM domain-containing protein